MDERERNDDNAPACRFNEGVACRQGTDALFAAGARRWRRSGKENYAKE